MFARSELQRMIQEQGHTCVPGGMDSLLVPIVERDRALVITATISHDGRYLRWYLDFGVHAAAGESDVALMQRLMEENDDSGLVHFSVRAEDRSIAAQVAMVIGARGLTSAEVGYCLTSLVAAADVLDEPEVRCLLDRVPPRERGHRRAPIAHARLSGMLRMSELHERYRTDGTPFVWKDHRRSDEEPLGDQFRS